MAPELFQVVLISGFSKLKSSIMLSLEHLRLQQSFPSILLSKCPSGRIPMHVVTHIQKFSISGYLLRVSHHLIRKLCKISSPNI